MKVIGSILAIIGFLLIIGVPGSSDFYEECRAAADCVAGEPMSGLRMFLQVIGGAILLVIGVVMLKD